MERMIHYYMNQSHGDTMVQMFGNTSFLTKPKTAIIGFSANQIKIPKYSFAKDYRRKET